MAKLFLNKLILFTTVLLYGCGGGGGSTDTDVPPVITPPPPVNNVPECSSTSLPNTLYCSVKHQDLDREFYVYVPDGIGSSITYTPLLFNLHGYRRQALDFLGYSGFQSIADEENFLVIYPQGSILPSSGEPHWNDSGWTSESPADDIDYISTLIDWAYSEYQINLSRVYATGKSNGGKMSYHLACNIGYRIAGVASVGGSMTPNTYSNCNPSQPTSIFHIHGDDDTVVPYEGNWRSTSVPDMMNYWKDYNNCQVQNIITLPDVNNDGDAGSIYQDSQCLNDIYVELFLMEGMGHDWPTDFNEYDIIAADEIWDFLKQFDINGKINF